MGSDKPKSGKRRKGAEPEQAAAPFVAYQTDLGRCILGRVEDALASQLAADARGKVDLIFTSPPFPLNRKKKYDNLQGSSYIRWLKNLAPIFREWLKPNGSIVVEVGNSWQPGKPVMSTLALESLLAFLRTGKLNLCQQFIWYNSARLPSPAQWVTVERIRMKDSYTNLWWMSPSERPKADNRRVLLEYSKSMRKLLETKRYNAGVRPSEHHIGKESFLKNNNGAIASNLLIMPFCPDAELDAPANVITMANTQANSDYLTYCRDNNIELHPARMPSSLAEFFIEFLTDPGDLVMDPFGGSNTTGSAAEQLGRRWLCIEANSEYVLGSRGRFASVY